MDSEAWATLAVIGFLTLWTLGGMLGLRIACRDEREPPVVEWE